MNSESLYFEDYPIVTLTINTMIGNEWENITKTSNVILVLEPGCVFLSPYPLFQNLHESSTDPLSILPLIHDLAVLIFLILIFDINIFVS